MRKLSNIPRIELGFPELYQSDTIHVLQIDDEPKLLELSKRIMIESNIEIDSVLNVKEALKKINTRDYDVIVTDYELPELNGLEFLKILRSRAIKTPFILFSGKMKDEVCIEALNLGADGYLNKYGNPEATYGQLKHKIIQLSNQYRNEKQHAILVDQYRQFFSNIPSAVVVYEAQGEGQDFVIRDFNFMAERIEKMVKKDVLGKCVTEVFPGAKDFGIFEVFQRVWKTGNSEHFPTSLYKDQREKGWRENWVIKLPNGNIAAIYNDISERKGIEQALVDSQRKFRALFEANPDASVFYDCDFRVIEANSRFCHLFGYSLEEILGRDIVDLIVPLDSKQESEAIRQRIRSGLVEIITTRRRKDGIEIPLMVSGSPVFSDEKLVGSMFVFKEISDIITVQDELNHALSKAQQLNERLKVISSLTRHDVRNKMSIITGYSYLLRKRYANEPQILDFITTIEQSIKGSVKIFDFARAYEQIGAEDLVQVNVENFVNEAVGMFSSLSFNVVNDCQDLIVKADSLLRQLIYNFIDNTRKYGKKTKAVRIYHQKKSDEILLFYEDDGVGIPIKNKKRLFERGFSTGGSTGFGLFLSKKILDFYGWSIAEIGESGKGAKFIIRIPKTSLGSD